MNLPNMLASAGVVILLIAFLLNLYHKLAVTSNLYKMANFIGALTCCVSSWLIHFYPFIVLESVWAAVALLSLFNVPRGTGLK